MNNEEYFPLAEISFSGVEDDDFFGLDEPMEVYSINGVKYKIYDEGDSVFIRNYMGKYAVRVKKWEDDLEGFKIHILQSIKLSLI